jgi:hypothetical protein
MDKIFSAMHEYPGRTIATVVTVNCILFLGGLAAVAVALRYVFTGHVG